MRNDRSGRAFVFRRARFFTHNGRRFEDATDGAWRFARGLTRKRESESGDGEADDEEAAPPEGINEYHRKDDACKRGGKEAVLSDTSGAWKRRGKGMDGHGRGARTRG